MKAEEIYNIVIEASERKRLDEFDPITIGAITAIIGLLPLAGIVIGTFVTVKYALTGIGFLASSAVNAIIRQFKIQPFGLQEAQKLIPGWSKKPLNRNESYVFQFFEPITTKEVEHVVAQGQVIEAIPMYIGGVAGVRKFDDLGNDEVSSNWFILKAMWSTRKKKYVSASIIDVKPENHPKAYSIPQSALETVRTYPFTKLVRSTTGITVPQTTPAMRMQGRRRAQ